MTRRLAALAAVALLTAAGGCGGVPAGTVVRVGDGAITKADLAHWMAALAPERMVPDPPAYRSCISHGKATDPQAGEAGLKLECRMQYTTLHNRALTLLISMRWLAAEARALGVHVSSAEVAQTMAGPSRPTSLDGGSPAPADERLVAEAAAIAAKLEQGAEAFAHVSSAQVAAYYKEHLTSYTHPETRDIYIAEHIPQKSLAVALRREVASGAKKLADIGLHESVVERHPVETVPGKQALARAIFTAKPHKITPLLLFDRQYAFLEVVRVTPGFVQTLAEVQRGIETQLAGERAKAAVGRLAAHIRRTWASRTDCSPGYVVQKCRQYDGPRQEEDPLTIP